MNLTIGNCGADLTNELMSFVAHNYGDDYILSRDPEFMRWQYGDADGSWRFKIAEVEGKIVGILGYIETTFCMVGESVRAGWACNWMIDDNYRDFGLGAFLLSEMMGDVDVSLSSGIKPNLPLRTMTGLGWRDCAYLPRLIAILDSEELSRFTCAPLPDDVLGEPPSRLQASSKVGRVVRFGSDVDALWMEVVGANGAGNARTAEYLNRRYAEHPRFEYRLFEGRRHGQLNAIAVYRIEIPRGLPGEPIGFGRMVEFLARPQCEEPMARTVMSDARASGCAALDFFCSHRSLNHALIKHGFVFVDEHLSGQIPNLMQPVSWEKTGINLAVYPPALLERVPLEYWYVTKSDNDQDRPN